MIKPKELQIDNLMQDQNGNILIVDSLFTRELDSDGRGIDVTFRVMDRSNFPLPDGWKAEPVPLTKDYPYKFGFTYHKAINLWMLNGFVIYWHSIHKHWFTKVANCIVTLEYVHQLQNAFSLTGEELTINQQP